VYDTENSMKLNRAETDSSGKNTQKLQRKAEEQ